MGSLEKYLLATNSIIDKEFLSFLISETNKNGFSPCKAEGYIIDKFNLVRRQQTIEKILKGFCIEHKKKLRVLDLGCGFGTMLIALEKRFTEIYGLEILEDRVVWAKKRAPLSKIVCASSTEIPWPHDYFDLIICEDVFEHMSPHDQGLAADEMFRVLRKNGHTFVSVPNKYQIYDEHNHVQFTTLMPHISRAKYVKIIGN